MSIRNLSRRDFGMLTMAALGGITAGCGDDGAATSSSSSATSSGPGPVPAASDTGSGDQLAAMLEEPHVCRGLNQCKGQGASGDNDCAGQGSCATAQAHSCHAQNDCKGQGGCSETAGINDCKGQGNCAVPLTAETWQTARANFEKAMATAGLSYGAAPAAE